MAITEGTQPAALTWTGAWTAGQTTSAFVPEAGALLVALLSGDGLASGSAATGAITDSLGGSWTLLKRQNTNDGVVGGLAEVWCRDSPGASLTVTATESATGAANGGQLTVRTLIGAKAAAPQTGATAGAKFNTAPVQVSVAAGTGNRIYGAALNWTASTAMTVLANTTAVTAFVDSTNGDNWAAFKSSGDTAGTATYGYSTSTEGQIAAVEILAADTVSAGGASIRRGPGRGRGPAKRFDLLRAYRVRHRDTTVAEVAAGNALADVANATGTADNPSVKIEPVTTTATATGVANDATVKIAPTPTTATGTGTANNPTMGIATGPSSAAGTGTANNPSPSIFVNAGLASATGTAFNPTVQTGSFTNAPAGLASGTGTANNPSPSIKTNAGLASATGTADNPSASIKVSPGVATATGVANNATITRTGNPQAGLASAIGVANNATLSIRASAEAAAALAQAFGGSISGGEFNATSSPLVTAGRTSTATAGATNTSAPAISAGRTSTSTTTSGITSTPSVAAKATSTSSVSDG